MRPRPKLIVLLSPFKNWQNPEQFDTDLALTRQLFGASGPQLLSRADTVFESGETRNIRLARPIPVVTAYWTAHAGDDWNVNYRADSYDANNQLIDLLDSVIP